MDKFFGLQRAKQVSSLLFGNSERLPIGATLAITTISLSSNDADLIDPTVLKGSTFHKKDMFLAFLFKGTAKCKIIHVQNDHIYKECITLGGQTFKNLNYYTRKNTLK